MHSAAQAYGSVAKKIANPRELEAQLLLKAASQLQAVRDAWDGNAQTLNNALMYNRKLWSVLLTSVTDASNPLPTEIRQNVANLGLFVMNHTLTVSGEAKPQRINSLININRELAAGLMAR